MDPMGSCGALEDLSPTIFGSFEPTATLSASVATTLVTAGSLGSICGLGSRNERCSTSVRKGRGQCQARVVARADTASAWHSYSASVGARPAHARTLLARLHPHRPIDRRRIGGSLRTPVRHDQPPPSAARKADGCPNARGPDPPEAEIEDGGVVSGPARPDDVESQAIPLWKHDPGSHDHEGRQLCPQVRRLDRE